MEEKRIKRYPIGVQTFKEIIDGGYHYIDKTGTTSATSPRIFIIL